MSKPQTKGETIGVRLPLLIDREVRKRAAEKGESAGLWIARMIVRSVQADRRTEAVPVSNVRSEKATLAEPANGVPIDCDHKDHGVVGGGLHRCRTCGRTRGMDGTWR